MNTITIKDSSRQIKSACEDLQAIRSVILTVGDHEEYANAYDALKVVYRALGPIIDDIKEAVDAIDRALTEEQ